MAATCLKSLALPTCGHVKLSKSARPQPRKIAVRSSRALCVAPAAKLSAEQTDILGSEVGKLVALTTVASSWLAAGNAQAAQELATVAASDNRIGTISILLVPVLGWVGFNILGPLSRQLEKMTAEASPKATSKRVARKAGLAVGLGLTALASMYAAESANAASEIGQLAASDNRIATIATLFVPVVGWALFNAGGPLLRQLEKMNAESPAAPKKKGTAKLGKKAGLAAALGLSASMLAVENADAATEIAQMAASDNRIATIATLFVPVVGWALFNAGGPLLRQLEKMNAESPSAAPKRKGTAKLGKKAGLAAAVGLSASMFMAENADAATEIAQMAASDNRIATIATLFVPVVGWALFNAGGPLLRQLEKMNSESPSAAPKKKGTAKLGKKAGLAAALGLSASMLVAEHADAATEVAQLAATDNRIAVIATLFVPVVGWVLFNAGGPLLRQFQKMTSENPAAPQSSPKKKAGTAKLRK